MPADLSWLPPLLVAPFVGSFLGVLILRLPVGRPVVVGRSVCDHCGTRLGVGDLLPVVSFALLRGRCRYCRGAIDPDHLGIEIAALAVVATALPVIEDPALLWISCLLGWTLLALGWIDARSMLLPDVLTLPLLLAGLGVTALRDAEALTEHATAALAAYLALRGLAWAYQRLRGRHGLGGGDAKLLAAAGAWLGVAALPWVLMLAATGGLVAAFGWMLAGRRMRATTALPFGPWLALSTFVLWLHLNREGVL